jgi:hypothetical protein
MSKVVIQGNASGTGNFTIAAPNSNTDRTLTLPDVAGTVLTSGSNADFPAGSILQVKIHEHSGGQEVFTSSTFTDSTTVTTTFTPKSASSKVFLIGDFNVMTYVQPGSGAESTYRISRDSETATSTFSNQYAYDYGGSGIIVTTNLVHTWLDSPATTSAVTYTLQVRHDTGTQTRLHYTGGTSRLTMFEVAA